MSDPFPTKDLVRVIFDRGLQALRTDDRWIIPSSLDLTEVPSPMGVSQATGARPIIYDTQFMVPFFQPRRVLDTNGRPVSRARYLKGYVEESDRRIYKYMVEHHLYCAVAHLGYLAEAYGGLAVLQNDNRWNLPEHVRSYSLSRLKDSAWRHGEAVFTSLCAAFDSSGPLFLADSSPAMLPFAVAVERLKSREEPALTDMIEPMVLAWEEFGQRLTDLRDVVAKHGSLDTSPDNVKTNLTDLDIWEVQMFLPDNPQDSNAKKFTFYHLHDLLDFSWRATCRLVRSIEDTLPDVYLYRQRRTKRGRWRRIKEAYGLE